MTDRYYVVDFKAELFGSVRVKAKNKNEAMAILRRSGDTFDYQVEDQVSEAKPYDFDITFIERTAFMDEDQSDMGPGAVREGE